MKKQTKKCAALLLALLVAVALVACGDSDDDGTTADQTSGQTTTTANEGKPPKPAAPTVPAIVVRDGAPVGGVQELEFDAGDTIRFTVSSNEADEVHVHGYDVEEEVPAGGTARFSFPADIEGIFEVELHHSEQQIAELRVEP